MTWLDMKPPSIGEISAGEAATLTVWAILFIGVGCFMVWLMLKGYVPKEDE